MSGSRALVSIFLLVLAVNVSAAEEKFQRMIGTLDSVNANAYMINISGTDYRFSAATSFRDSSKIKIFASQLTTGNQVLIEFAEAPGNVATVRSLQLLAKKPVRR